MNLQRFDAVQNDDKTLRITATENGDVSGDTYDFICTTDKDVFVFRTTPTISVNGSTTTKAVLLASLVDKLEVAAGDYKWQLRRTNVGREDTLAEGILKLRKSFRDL